SDRAKPYLVASGRRVVCVRPSAKGFPQVPLDVFRDTVNFEGMSAEQTNALRAALSSQLAARGAAMALVKNDIGNAVQLTYLFPGDTPTRIYYRPACRSRSRGPAAPIHAPSSALRIAPGLTGNSARCSRASKGR
ncbi:MAG TPA: hypothetical protein VNB23_05335, partial [Ramlibacter sp.]|nr:hypothetical protein [Ramlibacter sp.]